MARKIVADDRGGDVGLPEGPQVSEAWDHDRRSVWERAAGQFGRAPNVLVFSADDQCRGIDAREIGELVACIRQPSSSRANISVAVAPRFSTSQAGGGTASPAAIRSTYKRMPS